MPGKSPAAGSTDKPVPELVDQDLRAVRQKLQATHLRPIASDRSGNPPIEFNDVPFAWQGLDHPRLAKMAGDFTGSRLHTGCRTGKFLTTERLADVYPALGRTHIDFDLDLRRGKKTAVLPVVLYTINPHWKGFEVRFDAEGPWIPISRRVDWRLHAGRNIIEARLITQTGRRGRSARMELLAESAEDRARPSHGLQ